ncbi:MAG: metallophosphoesterase [Clostridia bacterium]|nr:metallophosphoesterase [Clostridia bacterium]
MKKIISVILSAIILLSCFYLSAFAEKKGAENSLQFNEDGKFTILNISDIQDGYPLNSLTKDYIEKTVDKVNPDLIVLTGDNISGYDVHEKEDAEKAIREFMDIFEAREIPVAAVFGNHDDEETKLTKEEQLTVYESYDCYVGERGFCIKDRVGTYNLPIMKSDGSGYGFNLWLTDSGTYNTENDYGGYACVYKEQIELYKETAEKLKEENGGKVVPAINFQHIIVPEIYDALKEVKLLWFGCVIRSKNPLNDKTRYYTLPDGAKGQLREYPCPPYYNNGQFDAMLETGDVLATVSGHDHENTFEIDYKGIKIINTPTIGFNAYNDINVGSRVFVINENDPENFETYCLTYSDVYTDIDELYEARILYNIDTTDVCTKLKSLIKIAKADGMTLSDFMSGVIRIIKEIQLF